MTGEFVPRFMIRQKLSLFVVFITGFYFRGVCVQASNTGAGFFNPEISGLSMSLFCVLGFRFFKEIARRDLCRYLAETFINQK
jgi:hypothetical protein